MMIRFVVYILCSICYFIIDGFYSKLVGVVFILLFVERKEVVVPVWNMLLDYFSVYSDEKRNRRI